MVSCFVVVDFVDGDGCVDLYGTEVSEKIKGGGCRR